ncbi:MAG TPA: VOC family protein [Solirubrobacteraceae bacterium]|nr:VOC family protein [Solirubrobacteraceae bacterium]
MSFAELDSVAGTAPRLPGALRLGAVHLTVTDVDRSVDWYQEALGLRVHVHEAARAELGDGREVVLVLHEDAQARPAGRHAGLYHYALLYPSRRELARAAVRLAATRTPIQGASDHGTHEAIYLPDPDGIGIELAADRPREAWPTPEEEFSRGGPLPLDLPALLGSVAGEDPHPQVGQGLRMGHVHLHVGDVERGLAFYGDLIGFEVWAQLPTAAFVSAGGYHHHLAFNTWMGRGVGPAPEHTVGLRRWTVQLPSPADVDAVAARLESAGLAPARSERGLEISDPWAITARFEVAP